MPDNDFGLQFWALLIGMLSVLGATIMTILKKFFLTEEQFSIHQQACQADMRKKLNELCEEQKEHKRWIMAIAYKLGIKDDDIRHV